MAAETTAVEVLETYEEGSEANAVESESLETSTEESSLETRETESVYEGKTPIIVDGKNADEIVAQMTLKQKIAQMIMPAFRTWGTNNDDQKDLTELNDEIRNTISAYGFGGVILFAQNTKDTEQVVRLTDDLQMTITDSGNISMLISVDQEGGIVTRLASGTVMTGNMALGADGSNEDAYATGSLIASEVDALGINVDFAPVMDVNNNPANPVIGTRSFSSVPDLTASLGVSFMNGIKSQGVADALKHFPGHGDTVTDSHVGLPSVDKSYEDLKNCELIPFKAAIEAGTDMVMTAHIQYPQIETETYKSISTGEEITLPATLSKTIITDILRGDMGFDGVVSTDALDMEAIHTHFALKDTAKLAINADVDILLMPVNTSTKEGLAALGTFVDDIEAMVQSGEIDEATVDKSAKRIVQMKIDKGIIDLSNRPGTLSERIENAKSIVGSAEHHQIEREIAQRAITVTENKNYTLPLNPSAGERVLILAAYQDEAVAMRYGLERLQREGGCNGQVQIETMSFTKGENMDGILAAIGNADYIITDSEIGSEAKLNPSDENSWMSRSVDQIIAKACELSKTIIVVSVGQPYDAARYPNADAILIAYDGQGMTLSEAGNPVGKYGENIPSTMDIIFGAQSPQGTLPVDVMTLDENYKYTDQIMYPLGYGISDLKANNASMTIVNPEKSEVSSSFESTVTLNNLQGLGNGNFILDFGLDESIEVEKVLNSEGTPQTYGVAGNQLEINVSNPSNQSDYTLRIQMKSKKAGTILPLTYEVYTDAHSREYTIEQRANAMMNIVEKQTETKSQTKQTIQTAAKKDQTTQTATASNTKTAKSAAATGDQTPTAVAGTVGVLSLIAIGGVIGIRRKKHS